VDGIWNVPNTLTFVGCGQSNEPIPDPAYRVKLGHELDLDRMTVLIKSSRYWATLPDASVDQSIVLFPPPLAKIFVL
jgi:hypothetical protein